MEAGRAGRQDECIRMLREAVVIADDKPELHFHLGFVLMQCGRLEEAIAPLERSAALQPAQFEAYVSLGRVYLELGRRDEAQLYCQRALLAAPGIKRADLSREPFRSLEKEISAAIAMAGEKHWALAEESMQVAHGADPDADLSRLELGLRIQCGKAPRQFNVPLRQPKFIYLPDLPATPWFEREQFEWVDQVERAYPEVRAEYESLLSAEARFVPYVAEGMASASGTDFSSLSGSMTWSSYHLNRDGWIEEARSRCPRTSALMDALPLAQLRGFAPEILYSRLEAGGHIVPHYGLMNVRLTVHLGVIVPNDCEIRVGTEMRRWEEGRVLAFDDSFEHEAWNRSDRDRAVLIFEVWHPDLRPAEIAGLEHLFEARKAWQERCAPETATDQMP